MAEDKYPRFKNLTFEEFRKLARDESLNSYEKIGFPTSYRQGKEELIFQDIVDKVHNLTQTGKTIFEIGPGCSGPAFSLIELCRKQGHTLLLADSQEMLDHLPDEPFLTKIPGFYPRDCAWLFDKYRGSVDAIITYSVLHYVFAEGNLYDFLDFSLSLLAEGGEMLIGDIPNVSKRKRFFSSANGIRFHRAFTGTDETPLVTFNELPLGQIDDAVIASLILRARQSGFDAYWLPQPSALPMANRREDIVIRKP